MHFLTMLVTLMSATGGTVSGRVTTSSGDPIADVQVSLTDLRRSTTTDSSGRYTIADVPDGTFTVSFQRIGYAPAVRRIVASGGNVTADVTMKESIVELTGIQVTASANATSALNSPQPTSVRSGDELRESQSPTLGETLLEHWGRDRQARHPRSQLEPGARPGRWTAARDRAVGR